MSYPLVLPRPWVMEAVRAGGRSRHRLRHLVVAGIGGSGGSGPTITGYTDDTDTPATTFAALDTMKVNGTGFGSSQGSGSVTVNGAAATVDSWSATQIVVTVPAAAIGSGAVVVTTNSGASDTGDSVTVTNPIGPCGTEYGIGKAQQFTRATSARLRIASNATLQMGAGVSMTLCGWFYLDDVSNHSFIAKWNNSTGVEYKLGFLATGDKFAFQWRQAPSGGISAVIDTTVGTASNWHFVIARHTAGVGSEIRSNANAWVSGAGVSGIASGTGEFRIGGDQEATPIYANGRIDAVGLWKRALTNTEADTLYAGGKGLAYADLDASIKTDLVSWWELGEITGATSWCDFHGTNHLSLGGGTVAQADGKT